MNWEHVATGALTTLVALAVIRRWRSHSRGRSIHIEFDWHSRQRDESQEAPTHDEPDRR